MASPARVLRGPEERVVDTWRARIASRANRDCSYANSKPYEDSALSDGEFVVVADGVTRSASASRVYPSPSPAASAARAIVTVAYSTWKQLRDTHIDSPELLLKHIAFASNRAVSRINLKLFRDSTPDYGEGDLAGACALCGIIRKGKFHYILNGDCVGYVVKSDGLLRRFTPRRTDAIDQLRAQAPEGSIRSNLIRQHIRNNPWHPARYGVFTGQARALQGDLLFSDTICLEGVSRLVFTTDGTDHAVDFYKDCPTEPEELIGRAEEVEDRCPAIRSDDKTVMFIDRPTLE